MLISIEQIKAARALLRWTQKDLAREAGLNDDQVHNFEAGRTKSLEVLEAIYLTLGRNGLDFSNGGVVPFKITSYVLNSYIEVLDDACEAMTEGGEILKHCADDRRSSPEVIHKINEIRNTGLIRERLTISDKNNFITGNKEDYRKIPDAFFSSYSEVIIIYLDRVVFMIEGKGLVLISKVLAETFRTQFEYWWKNGKPIK